MWDFWGLSRLLQWLNLTFTWSYSFQCRTFTILGQELQRRLRVIDERRLLRPYRNEDRHTRRQKAAQSPQIHTYYGHGRPLWLRNGKHNSR